MIWPGFPHGGTTHSHTVARRASTVWTALRQGRPIALMRWIIGDLTRAGDTVIDPFMGSGTTGVACVQTGRKFIGIEIDPAYLGIARKRIEAAQQQLRLPMPEESDNG